MQKGRKVRIGAALLILSMALGCGSPERRADNALDDEDFSSAIPLYQEHISQNPKTTQARAKLGYAYLKQGRFDDAIRAFRTVLTMDHRNPYAALYLGLAYLNKGDLHRALELWKGYRNAERPVIEKEVHRLLTLLKLAESKRAARMAVRQESRLPARRPARNTIAVAYYEDMTPDQSFAPLRKGLSSLIITYLSKIRTLQVVERMNFQALMEEMEFGQSGLVDPDSAPRVGRLLGAENLVTGKLTPGSIHSLSTLSSTAAGEVKGVLMHEVEKEKFFDLPILIVRDIVDLLKIRLSPAEEAALQKPLTTSYQAFIYYGQALQAVDAGNWKEARNLFAKALQQDPWFDLAREGRDALPELDFFDIDVFREIRPPQIAEQIEPLIERVVAEHRLAIDPNDPAAGTSGQGSGSSGSAASGSGMNDSEAYVRPNPQEVMEVQEILDTYKEESGTTVEFEW